MLASASDYASLAGFAADLLLITYMNTQVIGFRDNPRTSYFMLLLLFFIAFHVLGSFIVDTASRTTL